MIILLVQKQTKWINITISFTLNPELAVNLPYQKTSWIKYSTTLFDVNLDGQEPFI